MDVGSRLACLQLDQAEFQLLVPDSCARRLAVALLDGACPDQLAEIASYSPTLALWISCRAQQASGSVVFSSQQAGDWLSLHWRQLAGIEDRLADGPVGPVSYSRPVLDWQPYQDYAICLLAARLASQADQPEGICQQAAWLASLSRAEKWLAAVAPSPALSNGARPFKQLLPSGTVGLLEKMADDPATRDPVVVLAWESLAQATRLWRDPSSADASEQELLDQCQHWLPNEAADSDPLDLIGLLEKLARLTALDHDFQRQLEHEKLLSLKELAHGAAHEINNPLANISTRAETLLRSESDPERRRLLSVIYSQAMRVTEMISDMMMFAKPPQVDAQHVDLVAIARRAVDEMQELAVQQGAVVRGPSGAGPLLVAGSTDQLVEAIKSLCRNSLESCGPGGVVEVQVDCRPGSDIAAPATVLVEVTDNGAGIAEEVRQHMFDPFYSGREAGRGLGFGLSKCWRIVGLHGGRVEVENLPDGARLRIELPGLIDKAA